MRCLAIALIGLAATPALADVGAATSIPEPTDAILLLLGAAGVAIGRHMHARRDRKARDDKQD